VPWNWPGALQQRGSTDCKHKRCPSSARLSRYSCILGVVTHAPLAVPPSTGHELETLDPRWPHSRRPTSVVSLDEAVQVTSCQPNGATQPLSQTTGQSRRASARWRTVVTRGE